jgi:hypothetical protein
MIYIEMSPRVQEIMPCCPHRKALYRSYPRVKNRLHIGETMHRLWYLRKEMPIQRYQHYQSTYKLGIYGYASVLGQ